MFGIGFNELLLLLFVGFMGLAVLAALFFVVLAAVRSGNRDKGSGD